MFVSRRRLLCSALAVAGVIAAARSRTALAAQTIKISHQFPGGTITEGDFRDRLCRTFAAEIEKRTSGALTGQVYPNSSLMKTVAQFSALRKGALDLSLYPVSYAGGEFAELNIGLMPGLVSSYKQGAAWKTSEVGKKLAAFLAEKGVIIVSWIWQAGGVASRSNPIVNPQDAKGLKVRGGSREMDMVLQAAGATTLSTPSNELYAAMQTGACDAAITSCCCRSSRNCGGARRERAFARGVLRDCHPARHVRRYADRICARRSRNAVHDRLHAAILSR